MVMRVAYELSKSPATWDYVNFLVRAEQLRIERGQDGISIRIAYGERRLSPRDKQFSEQRKRWRINNLLVPLSRCLPSVVDVAEGAGVQQIEYLPPAGPQAPVLKAPAAAREMVRPFLEAYRKPVSITLRWSDFEAQRNSDLCGWEAACLWLTAHGYQPIIVPDAEAVLRGLQVTIGAVQYAPAALYPEARLALYEACVVNLMSAGGPMEMCLNADVPVMIWKLLVPGLPMNSEQNMARRGFIPMADWGPKKRIYMEPDTEAEILPRLETEMPAFEALRAPQLEAA